MSPCTGPGLVGLKVAWRVPVAKPLGLSPGAHGFNDDRSGRHQVERQQARLIFASAGVVFLAPPAPGSSWLLLAPPGSSWVLLSPPAWVLLVPLAPLSPPGSSWLLLVPPCEGSQET